MIKIFITNKNNSETKEYIQEPFTTMRTRFIPFLDECFQMEIPFVRIGTDLGTLECNYKTGEVFYINDSINIKSLCKNLFCKRVINKD